MALFSFRHSVKTFSPRCRSESRKAKRGQTAAHLKYITRKSAAREVISVRIGMPSRTTRAAAAEVEAEKRKGRVCERFIIALPVEATPEQRAIMANAFAEELTDGVAGFVLALHDKHGNDVRNPHFHLVAFDEYVPNGGRGRPRSVIGMSRKHAVQKWARRWAEMHNDMMSQWGFGPNSMISHESYADRGIRKIPEIHEGPASRQMHKRGVPMESKPEWRKVDAGHSRFQANTLIKNINDLNREYEFERANRLGNRNIGNAQEGISLCPTLGENLGRSSRTSVSLQRSKTEYPRTSKTNGGNFQPPWIAGRGSKSVTSFVPVRPGEGTENAAFLATAAQRWFSYRRRRFRRLFHELILLRDMLAAQVLREKKCGSIMQSSKVAQHGANFQERVWQSPQRKKEGASSRVHGRLTHSGRKKESDTR